jgi:hypothetical protein
MQIHLWRVVPKKYNEIIQKNTILDNKKRSIRHIHFCLYLTGSFYFQVIWKFTEHACPTEKKYHRESNLSAL